MSYLEKFKTDVRSSRTSRLFFTRSKKSTISKTRTPPSYLRFVNNIALEKFNTRFSERSVLFGKPINLASFAEYHIEDLFVRISWKEFLEKNEKIYPNFVQTFYANLTINEDKVIHSRVRGIDVSLSADDIF